MNATRQQQRYERFAVLRAAYPDMEFDRIMDRIDEEELDAILAAEDWRIHERLDA